MKNVRGLLVAGALAVLALPLAGALDNAAAENILMNAEFETGDLTNWETFGVSPNSTVTVETPDNGPSLPGTHNAFLNNRAEAIGLGIKQVTPVGSAMPGTWYYAFDLKGVEIGVSAVFFVDIFAEQEGVGIVGHLPLGPFFPTDWTAYQGTFVAPAGTNFMTMQFVAVTGAVVGAVSAYSVDNVYLGLSEPVAEETTNWGGVKALFR